MMPKVCDECGGKHYAKGRCKLHYRMPSQINLKIGLLSESKQKPIAKVSAKQLERLKLYKIAKEEHFKREPNCQFPGCTARDRQLHHACGRVGDLLFDKRYFKTLCDEHHKFVENNVTIAKELGLSADRLDK